MPTTYYQESALKPYLNDIRKMRLAHMTWGAIADAIKEKSEGKVAVSRQRVQAYFVRYRSIRVPIGFEPEPTTPKRENLLLARITRGLKTD